MALGNDNASFENFDPHDLWHTRLSMVISRRAVDHSVDEGCAYLYGGSWGYTWDEILKAFKKGMIDAIIKLVKPFFEYFILFIKNFKIVIKRVVRCSNVREGCRVVFI